MTFGLFLYQLVTSLIEPFIDLLLRIRTLRKKEDPRRRDERKAKNLIPRPNEDLLWIHSASVGESIVAIEVIKQVKAAIPNNLTILHTSQTVTSAKIIEELKLPDTVYQAAPLDSPTIAKRFIDHWKPKQMVLVEGEIWPNLLFHARKSGTRSILINARMTKKNLRGWNSWRGMARKLFGDFDEIICADDVTFDGLKHFSDKNIHQTDNLKSSLPPLDVDVERLNILKRTFIGRRKCLVATSTHPGDEELILEVYSSLVPRPALIIAPRHPDRGTQITKLVQGFGFETHRYSVDKNISPSTEVLVADTLGDLGLWYRLGDAIFLGGASSPGIGGHNPFEPVRLNKTVITGSHGYNFEKDFIKLSTLGAVTIADDKESLLQAINAHLYDENDGHYDQAVAEYLEQSKKPLQLTVNKITQLLS